MSSGRYIDLISNNVVLKKPNGYNSQTWFFDNNTKTIKSRKTTSYSLQMKSSGSNKDIVVTSSRSRWWDLWKFDGNFITNLYDGRAVSVAGNKDAEGTNIQAWNKNNDAGMKWRILYIDDKRADNRTTNDGFRVNEPFYIMSRLPLKRVIGGTSYVYLQHLTKAKTQKWRYDL